MPSGSRSRPKKVGLNRMDAALQHLGSLGFTNQEIRSTVKSLLEEYGGDEGWYFLEEHSYQLVLEAILDRQNSAPNQPPPLPPLPPPPPQEEKEEEGEQQHVRGGHNSGSGEEMKTKMEMNENEERNRVGPGDGVDVVMLDERLLHVIPPGRLRPPLFGYLSETDDDTDPDADSP